MQERPPEAVSQTRATSSIRPPRRHWWTALCSLSMGSRGLPCFFGLGVINSPATTRHSIVGKADGFSGADRFVGRLEAGDADDGADYEIHFGMVAT